MRAAFKHVVVLVTAAILVAPSPGMAEGTVLPSASQMASVLQRSLPGPGHTALKPIEGTWRVEMTAFMGLGSPDKPVVSTDIICRREWVAGGRYLHDVTEGTLAGAPYYREGLLGYSNIDARYEWVTVDTANSMMMIYVGEPGSGVRLPISVSGTFTDQGWLGKDDVGKPVHMRTVIKIESNDSHVFELYFTPSGGTERLVDRKVYTRMRE